MTKGYIMVAMGDEYVKQAYLCATSIKKTQTIKNVSLVTSDNVPKEYQSVFDKIIEVPWHDKNARSFYKTEHRWKVFHLTPYDETIVLDTDMLFLSNVSHWWKYFSQKSVGFVTNVKTYRGTIITNDYYRKAFTANHLPNVYCAFHYFKKDDTALKYYEVLNSVCENYNEYYKVYAPKHIPKVSSMDVNHAITLTHCGIQDYTIDPATFVHMKSRVQDLDNVSDIWTDILPFYLSDDIKIGNYTQKGILHYTENKFCEEALCQL